MNGSSDLQKLIAACELGTAATPNFYVPRQPSVTSQIEIALQPSQSSRVLLMGQNGVGKSTELNRLEMQFSGGNASVLVIAPSIDRSLDLRLFGWHELLLYSACSRAVASPDLRSLDQQYQPLLKKFRAASFQDLLVKMSEEPASVRGVVVEARALVWDEACGLIRRLEAVFNRPALLIWDGLEKLSRTETQKLFEEEGRYLDQLPCRAVITAPMRMGFAPFFTEVADRFSANVIRLRAMSSEKIKNIAVNRGFVMSIGELFATGLALLKEAPLPRVYEQMVNRLLNASAGLPRQLLQLIAAAAKQALSVKAPTLLPEHVSLAIRRAGETMRYQLEPADVVALDRPLSALSNETKARLLDIRALVEYEDAESGFRFEVNPLLTEMLATGR